MTFEIDTEWAITDDSVAEWALQRIAEEKAEYERLQSLADKQIEEIKLRAESAKKRYERKTAFINGKLMEYFHNVPHKSTKTTEKYALLSGNLVLKKAAKKPVVDDEKLVEWLGANGYTDYIKTEQSARWGDLKKALDLSGEVPVFKETGEVVKGVTFEDVPEEFKVELLRKGDE